MLVDFCYFEQRPETSLVLRDYPLGDPVITEYFGERAPKSIDRRLAVRVALEVTKLSPVGVQVVQLFSAPDVQEVMQALGHQG